MCVPQGRCFLLHYFSFPLKCERLQGRELGLPAHRCSVAGEGSPGTGQALVHFSSFVHEKKRVLLIAVEKIRK